MYKIEKHFSGLTSGWQVGDTVTINGLVYTAVNSSPTTDGEFEVVTSSNTTQTNLRIAINADTRIGTYTDGVSALNDNALMSVEYNGLGVEGNNVELVLGSGNTGSASVYWSPMLGGNDYHRTYVAAREQEGVQLVEVNNIISVNPPEEVYTLNRVGTSVDVYFIEPTANANGTELYEVWLEDLNKP